MSWWFRLRRLWGQDRIRLSPSDVQSPRVRVGDHLEIYGRLWTVEEDLSSRPDGGCVVNEAYGLVHRSGPTRRLVLRRPAYRGPSHHDLSRRSSLRQGPSRETPWILEDEEGRRRVCWRDVIQYGVRPDFHRDVV